MGLWNKLSSVPPKFLGFILILLFSLFPLAHLYRSPKNFYMFFSLVTYYLCVYASLCYKLYKLCLFLVAIIMCYKMLGFFNAVQSYSIQIRKYLGSRKINSHYILVNTLYLYGYKCFDFSLNILIIILIFWHNGLVIMSNTNI